MLKNTFCHMPGIGARYESYLWSKGLRSWDDILSACAHELKGRTGSLKPSVEQSSRQLADGNAAYFTERLPHGMHWRLFPEFSGDTAYLDIETNGVMGPSGYITTIALYDGSSVYYYVNGQNLDDFKEDIKKYKVIVTYNGRCFDVPFIESHFNIKLTQAHIDLRFLLKGMGITGGLKGCEKMLGIDRSELDGLDGFFAVLLWRDFQKRKDEKTLETLLAYNIEDAINLEPLLIYTYNLKLRSTPFPERKLPTPPRPALGLRADMNTIRRIINENRWYFAKSRYAR